MPRPQPPPYTTASTLLPYEVRAALVAASKLPDQMERRRAIEEVTERAKRNHPQFFQTDQGVTS